MPPTTSSAEPKVNHAAAAADPGHDDVLSRHGITRGWERFHAGDGINICDLSVAHDDRLLGRPVLVEWIVDLPPVEGDDDKTRKAMGHTRQLWLSELTGQIAQAVEESCGGLLLGAVESPSKWRGIFAAKTDHAPAKTVIRKIAGEQFIEASAMRHVTRRLRGGYHTDKFTWQWHVKRGAARRTFERELYPGLHGQHEILTRHVTKAIERDLTAQERLLPRVVHHTLWMPNLDMARRAGMAMAADGFACDVKPRDDDKLPAKLLLSRPTLLKADAMLPFVWNFCDLCEGVGGEYRGWGVYLTAPEDDRSTDESNDASAGSLADSSALESANGSATGATGAAAAGSEAGSDVGSNVGSDVGA